MKHTLACALLAATLLPLSPLWLRAADSDATPDQTSTTTTQPASAPLDPQAEAANRQQLKISANQAISDGQRFLGSGQFDQAADRFQYALDALTPGGASATSYNRAETGLAAAKAGQADALAKQDRFAEAATLLQQAVVLQPDNPVYPADIEQLKKEQLAYEEQIRDPEGTVNNPAVTDEFKVRVAAIQKLLFQGDAYFRTGQLDRAEQTFSKILLLDPYNKAARDKMDHIVAYKNRADGFRHEEYELSKMEQIDHEWSEDISPDVVSGPAIPGANSSPSNRANITRKLQSIIIDKVNFDKLDIATVIQYLQQKSKELDPDHQGINFVLRLTADAAPVTDVSGATGATPAPGADAAAAAPAHPIHREVSITLKDVPLADILGYVIAQTNLQYTVEDYAVYLRPSIDEGETLSVRTFLVPPNFFEGSALKVTIAAPTDQAPSTVSSVASDAQQSLTDKGIRFPAGASAIFLPGSSRLVVRDTPEQLDLVANLIDQLSQETPQIEIEAKIAEFTQDALKGLSFNYLGGDINASVGPNGASIGAQSALRTPDFASGSGNGGLTANSINSLIQQNGTSDLLYPIQGASGPTVAPNASNQLIIGAVLDGKGFQMVMDAINNLTGVSLLSAPSVTTQNNLKANIDIVREFPYPTSFERPQLSNNSNLVYPAPPSVITGFLPPALFAVGPLSMAIPPTPREFVTQDVGVSLEVKPTTYPDQRIDLDITKAQVLDFDGFINYGVPIVTRLSEDVPPPDEPGTVLTPSTINQPVFNLRSMVTDLQVLDGQTAVLGGLLNEDTQEINDKVPVLGDIPLFGRLFQSKVTERTKKNLIFFVTARLIRTNGKPQYIKTLDAEPIEEALPEPDQQIGPGGNLPSVPEVTPNS